VVDAQGAAVPGATVTTTSLSRKTPDTVVTDSSGYYERGRLLPGTYEVRAELTGFKAKVVSAVNVSVDTQTKVALALELGDMTETVTVESVQSQLLKTDRADVATTFESKQITELPVLDRNFTKFVLLTPGTQRLSWNHATSENPQGSIQTMVNGQHFSGTGFQLDGTENRDPILGIIVINPTLESIGESKITAQNYDAEFGQATAGVVSVVTKSGSNQFHGSAFEFHQSDKFQARNPYSQPDVKNPITGRVLPETKRDQFGGSLGGPILKDKLFFFGDYQGWRYTDGGSKLLTVPTALARTGNLSEYGVNIFDPATGDPASRVQFPGNVIPTGRLSPQALGILNLLPLPNAPGSVNGTRDNFIAQGSELFNSDAFNVRVDSRINSRLNVFGRYSYAKFAKDGPSAFGAGGGPGVVDLGGNTRVKNQSLALGLDYTLSASSVLDFRFGYFKYNVNVFPNDYGSNPALDAGIPGMNFPDNAFTSGLPGGFINGGAADMSFGTALGDRTGRCNCPLLQDEKQFQFVELDEGTGHQAHGESRVRRPARLQPACAERQPPLGRDRLQRGEHPGADGRRPGPRHVPARKCDQLSPLRQLEHQRQGGAMALVRLRAGHLATQRQADDQLRPPARGHHAAVDQRGRQRRLLGHRHRRDDGGRGGRHSAGRRRRELDQPGAPPGDHVPAQREDRGPDGLRPQLRHWRVRVHLRPQRDPEPARAGAAGSERASELREHLQPGPGADRSRLPRRRLGRPLRGA
jgi:hypothetical protein